MRVELKEHVKLREKHAKLLAFVEKINDGFCLNQTDEEGLKMLVGYEIEAEELLKEIGEIE